MQRGPLKAKWVPRAILHLSGEHQVAVGFAKNPVEALGQNLDYIDVNRTAALPGTAVVMRAPR
jgi:hypothetical protein